MLVVDAAPDIFSDTRVKEILDVGSNMFLRRPDGVTGCWEITDGIEGKFPMLTELGECPEASGEFDVYCLDGAGGHCPMCISMSLADISRSPMLKETISPKCNVLGGIVCDLTSCNSAGRYEKGDGSVIAFEGLRAIAMSVGGEQGLVEMESAESIV